MHVVFDAVGARYGGTAMVALDVVGASLQLGAIDRVTVFATAERRFAFPDDARLTVVDAPRFTNSGAGRIAWQLVGAARAAKRRGADVFVGLSNGGVGMPGQRTAVFLQQALPFSPEALARMPAPMQLRMRAIREVMRLSVRRAALIAVQTDGMRDDVCKAFALPPERVRVFTPAAPQFPATSTPVGAIADIPKGERLLYVGSNEPYKDVAVAAAAAERLRRDRPGLRLVATITETLPSVTSVGHVDRASLRALYEDCDLLLMPSLCESVGLPLLEAMSLGLPIVAADKAYARAVCGDAAVYVEAGNVDAFYAATAALLGNSAGRAHLARRGRERAAALVEARPYERLVEAFVQA